MALGNLHRQSNLRVSCSKRRQLSSLRSGKFKMLINCLKFSIERKTHLWEDGSVASSESRLLRWSLDEDDLVALLWSHLDDLFLNASVLLIFWRFMNVEVT